MSIEKLELVSIAGELPHLNDAIVACLQSKTFHLENAAKLLGSSGSEEPGGSHTPEVNPYAEPLKRLAELDLRKAAIDVTIEPLPAEFTPEQIIAETDRISGSLRDVQQKLRQTRQQVAEYESAAIHLKYLGSSDLDLGELKKCRHILYRFGRMPEENVQKLEFYSDQGFIFQIYHTESEYVWGFYFATQERILAVDAIMKGLLFEELRLPEDLTGTPQEALSALQILVALAAAGHKAWDDPLKRNHLPICSAAHAEQLFRAVEAVCAVLLADGEKVVGRQRRYTVARKILRKPDHALVAAGLQFRLRGVHILEADNDKRCGSVRAESEAKQERGRETRLVERRNPARQLQHDIDGLQTVRVGLDPVDTHKVALQAQLADTVAKLAQHRVELICRPFLRQQGVRHVELQKLLAFHAAEVSDGVENKFLLFGKRHADRLPSGGKARLLRYGSTMRSLSLSQMALKIVAIV